MFISRITPILSFLKRFFNWTNPPLFLHCFCLLFNSRTTVQHLEVIIIYTIYYWSSIVLWSFSYHIWVVDCRHVFFRINRIRVHWSWNLSLGVLENCPWDLSKPDINICFPRRFIEGRYEGAGWVFIIVRFNWLLLLI